MSLKDFKKTNIKDYEINRLQENIGEYVAQFTSNPLLDGRVIENIVVSTTATEFAHGLGRELRGYFIVKSNTHVTIYNTTSITPKTSMKLVGSTTATISVYVF